MVKNQTANAGDFSWVRKIPWRWKWKPTPLSCLGNATTEEPGGLQSMGVSKELDTTE